MKFLIMNRPNGADPGDWDMEKGRKYTEELQRLLNTGEVEAAYVLLAGGHAYIVDADNTAELAMKIRYNPLYGAYDTQVIPVENALDYLAGYAEHLKANYDV